MPFATPACDAGYINASNFTSKPGFPFPEGHRNVKTPSTENGVATAQSDLIALVFVLSRIGRLNQLLLANVQAELKKSARKPRTEFGMLCTDIAAFAG